MLCVESFEIPGSHFRFHMVIKLQCTLLFGWCFRHQQAANLPEGWWYNCFKGLCWLHVAAVRDPPNVNQTFNIRTFSRMTLVNLASLADKVSDYVKRRRKHRQLHGDLLFFHILTMHFRIAVFFCDLKWRVGFFVQLFILRIILTLKVQ